MIWKIKEQYLKFVKARLHLKRVHAESWITLQTSRIHYIFSFCSTKHFHLNFNRIVQFWTLQCIKTERINFTIAYLESFVIKNYCQTIQFCVYDLKITNDYSPESLETQQKITQSSKRTFSSDRKTPLIIVKHFFLLLLSFDCDKNPRSSCSVVIYVNVQKKATLNFSFTMKIVCQNKSFVIFHDRKHTCYIAPGRKKRQSELF